MIWLTRIHNDRLKATGKLVNQYCRWGGCVFLIVMLTLVIIQVVARYVFDSPPFWTEEAARYCMIWSGFLGATVAFHEKLDPTIVSVDKFNGKWIFICLQLIRACAVITFIGPVLYYSPAFIIRHIIRLTEALEIPMAMVVAIVPISLAIILFHLLVQTFSDENVHKD